VGVDCTDNFIRKKAIEKTILRMLRPSEFSHSLGAKRTYDAVAEADSECPSSSERYLCASFRTIEIREGGMNLLS